MLSDITLGQYFPGNSIVHVLDPRIKLICIIFYIVSVFSAKSFISLGLVAMLTILIVLVSRLNFSTILKSLKPVIFILCFTMIANLFWTTGENLLISLGFIKIYAEGVTYAIFMATRIICLIIGTFVMLTYTTSPVALTDAIERLLYPFSKIGLPVHEFSMMMTIALRFIPTLLEETEKIINAQKARGADFESGNLLKRAKALVPILIPLFVSAFRRADELACAMECRLYHGGKGRTKMKVLQLKLSDIAILLFFIIFTAGVFCLRYIIPSCI